MFSGIGKLVSWFIGIIMVGYLIKSAIGQAIPENIKGFVTGINNNFFAIMPSEYKFLAIFLIFAFIYYLFNNSSNG